MIKTHSFDLHFRVLVVFVIQFFVAELVKSSEREQGSEVLTTSTTFSIVGFNQGASNTEILIAGSSRSLDYVAEHFEPVL
jgi:hypothetical protein